MKMEQILLVHSIYKWNSVPKRRHIKFIRRGTVQLKCDGTRWRTGWGSEGETGEWSG